MMHIKRTRQDLFCAEVDTVTIAAACRDAWVNTGLK
jgi:hypothetical protein